MTRGKVRATDARRRGWRRPAVLAAILGAVAVARCGGGDDSATDARDAADTPTDGGGTCPPGARSGGACTDEPPCRTEPFCQPCGMGSWLIRAANCTCHEGTWQCDHVDCGPYAPGTYADPDCTVLHGADADADVEDDVTDADVAPDVEPDVAPDVVEDGDTGPDGPGDADAATDAPPDTPPDVDDDAVDAGDALPECKEVAPGTHGMCDMLLGVIYDGTDCVYESGCTCDPDCAYFFRTMEDCLVACF